MAIDISAVGAQIAFHGGDLNGLVISEFSDDGTPFDAPDVDVSTNAKNLNGEMISSRTPSVYPFSITVIPGSKADLKLRAFFADSALQPGNNAPTTAKYIESVTISMPSLAVSRSGGDGFDEIHSSPSGCTYTNVRAKTGPTGPSTSADGRLAARTYTFEAEGYQVDSTSR